MSKYGTFFSDFLKMMKGCLQLILYARLQWKAREAACNGKRDK